MGAASHDRLGRRPICRPGSSLGVDESIPGPQVSQSIPPPSIPPLPLAVAMAASHLLAWAAQGSSWSPLRALASAFGSTTEASALPRAPWTPRERLLVASLGLSVLSRNLVNMFATRLTRAHWVQMITSTTPLIVAAWARLAGDTLAPRTLPAMGLSLAGVTLAVVGGSASAGSGGSQAFSWRDVGGIALSAASALTLAAYMVLVKQTGGFIREEEVMIMQFVLLSVPVGAASFLFEAGPWLGLLSQLDAAGWAALFGLSIGVFCLANLLHQKVIKKLGAAVSATVMPLRLVSAIGFAFLLLGEQVRNWVEALGLAVVFVTITWYLLGTVGGSGGAPRGGAGTPVDAAAAVAAFRPAATVALPLGKGAAASDSCLSAAAAASVSAAAASISGPARGCSPGAGGTVDRVPDPEDCSELEPEGRAARHSTGPVPGAKGLGLELLPSNSCRRFLPDPDPRPP